MSPVAYLAIGERAFRAVFLAEAESSAIDAAAKHHGHVEELVLKRDVIALVRAAREAGLAEGRAMAKEAGQ